MLRCQRILDIEYRKPCIAQKLQVRRIVLLATGYPATTVDINDRGVPGRGTFRRFLVIKPLVAVPTVTKFLPVYLYAALFKSKIPEHRSRNDPDESDSGLLFKRQPLHRSNASALQLGFNFPQS